MTESRRYREAGGRMFDEPGVGARSGMRVKDGAFDLDDFLEAGRKALHQGGSGIALAKYNNDQIEGSEDESVGTARHIDIDTRASSSMMIVDSPGPSPRSTIRRSHAPSSSPFLSSPGTARHQSPFPNILIQKKNKPVAQSSDGNGSISMSSPSKIKAKRQAFATGLEARKQKKRLEELEKEAQVRELPVSASIASSSQRQIDSEDESTGEGTEGDASEAHEGREVDVIVHDHGIYDNDDQILSKEQSNLDDLPEFQSSLSEGLDRRQSSPLLLEVVKRPKKILNSKATEPDKVTKDKRIGAILQEKNGLATQSRSTALAKARKKVNKEPSRKQKSSREEENNADQRKNIEKIPSSFHRQPSVDEGDGLDDGLRRGSRYRYKPLEYWRGEKARFGRPSLPKVSEHNVGDETIDGDAFEDHFAGEIPPVAVLKEIIRVPRLEGEGTFSGMKIRKERSSDQTKISTAKRPRVNDDTHGLDEVDPTQPSRHAESGWDDNTEMKAKIWDAESKAEVDMQVACTSSQVRPRLAVNSTFGFEKVFVVDHTMASGILFILVDGVKATKSSKDNNYTFVVLEGAVKVHLHKSSFIIAPHGMFFVPAKNDYSIENISKRTAKVAFTQCRNNESNS